MALTWKNKVLLGSVSTALMLGATGAWAGLKLDSTHSSVGFSSVKNDSVMEQHGFRNLSGSISAQGEVSLSIDLTSVDTKIQIRDERMKKELFNTEVYPLTIIEAKVDSAAISGLSAGQTVVQDVEFKIDLHGKSEVLNAKVQVTGLDDGGLLVSTINPVELQAGAFGLDEGIGKLKDIAKLNSILLTVPVNANLVFVSE
ncbi:YceI family protein [Photobacterium sp. ZSDE20]|uniref:YceI family protein n=1 Tax=Photobacterium pectinilyticum TaxID=2906793 RepID=A0ABT1N821_9GAMM|nr:YceI family protein [Photobacterium sp. ZSDE20]MCQ1060907.1 YceI family protein [Photobacterium sp. ZSDE20]MDD1828806.1 YceI family protein [Photobacterium sp. ZSDE20]